MDTLRVNKHVENQPVDQPFVDHVPGENMGFPPVFPPVFVHFPPGQASKTPWRKGHPGAEDGQDFDST